MRIAAIISGELRFKDQKHFKAFSHAMSSFTPRYIVTYLAYETLALQLGCNVLITEPLDLEKGSASHLYQWHLLQLAMRAFAFGDGRHPPCSYGHDASFKAAITHRARTAVRLH